MPMAMSSSAVVVVLLALFFAMPHCMAAPRAVLLQGDILVHGDKLDNGRFRLVMQEDCDLVMYDNNSDEVVWHSNTGRGPSKCFAYLTNFGKVRICDGPEFPDPGCNIVWETSQDFGSGNYVLALVDNMFTVYRDPLWDTGVVQ